MEKNKEKQFDTNKPQTKTKLSYQKPALLSIAPLEAVAASCPPTGGGKAQGQPGCTIVSS